MRTFNVLLLATTLVMSSIATAQEKTGPAIKVGIGLAYEPSNFQIISEMTQFSQFYPISLRIPVHAGNIKFEPEIGIYSGNRSATFEGDTDEDGISLTRVGAGIYYASTVMDQMSLHVGPRLGIQSISFTSESKMDGETLSTEASRSDFFVGLVLGVEYFLHPRFSMGIEGGLEYVSIGDEESSRTPSLPTSSPSVESSGSDIVTKAAITGRFYF